MRRPSAGTRGFSLTELVAVVAVIAVTAAILFPVLTRAKAKAKEPPCASNMRQIGLALEMYRGDSDTKYPLFLKDLVAGNAAVKAALVCPSDETGGANVGETARTGSKVSVIYWRPYPEGYREAVADADPNHGVAYCVLHGRRLPSLDGSADPRLDTTGTVVRLKADGSVKNANVGLHCGALSNGSTLQFRTEWSLLTDAACVKGDYCEFAPNACRDPRDR